MTPIAAWSGRGAPATPARSAAVRGGRIGVARRRRRSPGCGRGGAPARGRGPRPVRGRWVGDQQLALGVGEVAGEFVAPVGRDCRRRRRPRPGRRRPSRTRTPARCPSAGRRGTDPGVGARGAGRPGRPGPARPRRGSRCGRRRPDRPGRRPRGRGSADRSCPTSPPGWSTGGHRCAGVGRHRCRWRTQAQIWNTLQFGRPPVTVRGTRSRSERSPSNGVRSLHQRLSPGTGLP